MKNLTKQLFKEVKQEMADERVEELKVILRSSLEQLQESKKHVRSLEKRVSKVLNEMEEDLDFEL